MLSHPGPTRLTGRPRPPVELEPLELPSALVDGRALFTAACELGFEGVVAKNHSSLYRPNDRGWVKVKNPNYWRRDLEQEAMAQKHERRAQTLVGERR